MILKIYFLRRWDALTYLIDSFRTGRFKPSPKPKHAPLSTRQMTDRIKEELGEALKGFGFCLVNSDSIGLTWERLHPPLGQDRLFIQFISKNTPELLRVDVTVGLVVPVIQNALHQACGNKISSGEPSAVGGVLSGSRLVRVYDDPLRPKRRRPFPDEFIFWGVDFRSSEIESLKNVVRRYALPYYDRFKSLGDLREINKSAENQAALLVHLGESQAAIDFLEAEFRKVRRYSPEMLVRLECLLASIKSGEFKKILVGKATP
jgi:hypothetical protein